MNISKFAQTPQLSFDVPDNEKVMAKKAVKAFLQVKEKIEALNTHLDIIYNPFNAHQTISTKSIIDNRGALIRYKNKVRDNFNNIAKTALYCVAHMNQFSNDTHSVELMRSFVESIGDIEDQVKIFDSIFKNLKAKEFRDNVLKVVQGIKKQAAQVTKLIDERLLNHINTNILATNWKENLSQELKFQIEDKEPYIKRLYNDREKQVEDMLKGNGS
jgi:uncharacterized protein Yka (UPF0111/DUF47 family)